MVLIKSVWFEEANIFVHLNNGKIISKPIICYKNLSRGTKNQLANYKIEGDGRWIHWEDLDEDLSAEGFSEPEKAI